MTHFVLRPEYICGTQPFRGLLQGFRRLGFDPTRCRSLLQRALTDHGGHEYFDLDGISSGGYFVTEKLLFGAYDHDRWAFAVTDGGDWLRCDVDAATAGELGQMIYAFARHDPEFERVWRATFGEHPVPTFVPRGNNGEWPAPRGPSIVRREHASLLIDSGSTRILLDPQRFEDAWTTNDNKYPDDREYLDVDAICLSHSHGDHFSLPSMIGSCREGTLCITPRVPRANLLCPDMRRCAEIVGLDAVDPAWGEILRIGDIEIEILPFYGEQPTRSRPTTPHGVRNWGSCYRFDTPTFSAAVLVDSGIDPMGSVYESLRRSVERAGPIDVLLSCCSPFPEVINMGLTPYVLTQPFDVLVETWAARRRGETSPSITFGADGVARACESARARYFMPYAHGFDGLGTCPRTEATDTRNVETVLGSIGSRTRVIRWSPGDTVHLGDRSPVVTPWCASPTSPATTGHRSTVDDPRPELRAPRQP